MAYRRILTIQDISCVGQCSLTVALPILSACGHETAILPSAVLSTHTAGFTGWTCRDLTDDMPAINTHWNKEGLRFEAVYTGYLGSTRQIDYVKAIMNSTLTPEGLRIVDPAMADHGKLYPAFDMEYVEAMKSLCAAADYLLPNVTEACFLTGMEYREEYDEAYIDELLQGLRRLGARDIVLTGVSFSPDTLGVMVYENGQKQYHPHRRIPQMFHGTGDVYASAFTGAYLRGRSLFDSACVAADYTLAAIENTVGAPEHWYGVRFEPVLPVLIERLKKG